MSRGGETPIQVSQHWLLINPLSPHDALKHHFTSLKTEVIFQQLRILERKFPWNWFTNTWHFSLLFHPHQIIFIRENCDSNSRLVVDEDDNVKSGLKGGMYAFILLYIILYVIEKIKHYI